MRIRNTKNRRGLTLIFVVSMIVLFLLMGTTFVVISNDYFRAARTRARAELYTIDRTALVHRSVFNLIRGPELLDTNSPLRGHDLMSDEYGYGFKASVLSAAPVDPTRGQLIEIIIAPTSSEFKTAVQLSFDNGTQIRGFRDMLADASAKSQVLAFPNDLSGVMYDTASGTWLDPQDGAFTPATNKNWMLGLDTPGYFSGQIMTFTTGIAERTSARIIDYTVTEDTRGPQPVMIRRFVVLPERLAAGTDSPFDTPGEIAQIGEIRNGGGFLTNKPSTIVINGRPYSGFGAGASSFASIAPNRALRPNTARYQPTSEQAGGTDDLSTGSTSWDGDITNLVADDPFFQLYSVLRNSVNEPWDSFDEQNVFLAQNHPSAPVASFNPTQLAPKHADINDSDPNLMPKRIIQQNAYSFRPVYQWHPDYVNDPANPRTLPSNTANQFFPNLWDDSVPIAARPAGFEQLGIPHELQTRPLDVDNDQDGVKDSVWVDQGHGIITTPDGRRIKPLVAAMIIDLDNRLNVNAHGNFAHAQALATLDSADRPGTFTPGYMVFADLLGIDSTVDTGLSESWDLARGLGWGPPEVSLSPLAPTPTGTLGADYRALLVGSTDTAFNTFPEIPGRYGFDRLPGNSFFDSQAAWRFLDHPYPGTIGGSFQGRSMDIHGRFATGFPQAFETFTIPDPLDATMTIDVDAPYGTPVIDVTSTSWPPAGPLSLSDPTNNPFPATPVEIYNSPYEVSLVHEARSGDDLLYSPDELEAVVRPFDVDSQMLASRLKLFGLDQSTQRHLVTTDSWEVPALPPMIFDSPGGPVNRTIPERLYEILSYGIGGGAGANGPGVQNAIFSVMRGGTRVDPGPVLTNIHSLLAPEVMQGLPMNVNRVFGNGIDDNGNGVIDEHWNSGLAAENEAMLETYPLDASVSMDHNNDGTSDFQDRFVRQIFARHLYVLTWLVTGGDWDGTTPSATNPAPPDMDGSGGVTPDDYALLAQWCINVVDFRDADSICTPFKYDKNPWDGWEISPDVQTGDPAAYDGSDPLVGVVWGVERPELLLSEALATHERRYEDADTNGNYLEGSRYVPKASVFVEIYNPWTSTTFSGNVPAEMYFGGSVDLADSTITNGDPVWRLAFTRLRNDDATDANVRRVYMREPTVAVEANPAGNFYYPSLNAVDLNGNSTIDQDEIPVAPNGYAVIGSAGVERNPGEYRTTFGRRTDLGPDPIMDLKLDETRAITLIPGRGVEVVDGADGTAMVTERRLCTAVPIDTKGMGASLETRSLGITDPIAGYGMPGTVITEIDPDGNGNPDDGDGWQYLAPQVAAADDQTDYPDVYRDGNNYATAAPAAANLRPQFVQLQRLANPLVDYHAEFNPYITVDVAPVDLLSFNGLEDTGADVGGMADVEAFDTQERGDMKYLLDNATATAPWSRILGTENERLLWPEEDIRVGMTDVPKEAADQHFYPQQFAETFGAMNDTYRGFDANVSDKPFLWMTWNNRPYVSQYELINVPLYRGKELLNTFSEVASQVIQVEDSKFKRVFDFLDVPSRFVNMEIGFDPPSFNGDAAEWNNSAAGEWFDNPTTFNAPGNYASRYRYPGLININTLTANQSTIWTDGMFPNWGVAATQLAGVRADSPLNHDTEDLGGYGSTATAPPTMVVMDPIRPDGSVYSNLPMLPNDLAGANSPPALNAVQRRRKLSDATSSDGSILRYSDSGTEPNFLRNSALPHANTSRDYWFTNSSVSKLANISTNRSSVFAIWITVGYFEVDDQGRLGAESGEDTGDVIRNRGFYIFDRSIPMGFEPGKNHNIERGILVQSIIE